MGAAREAVAALAAAGDPGGRLARQLGTWNTVVEFGLDGEDGSFHLVVRDGQLTFRPGRHPQPVTRIEGTAAAFAPVARGEIDITHPLAHGDLRLTRGDWFDALNFSKAVVAVRRKG
ncbi:MAG: SCP2 sterol-binding domain-containing protein [Chloroflexi bacterium]|nr:SCP2 sterol-binding domain-containing protein [Chloroflexota bacterium]MBI4506202.1 SCP2 sterol-binding domain-containing protein [Chloroflexota bacterium]